MILRPISEFIQHRSRLRTQALRNTWHLVLVELLGCLKMDPAPDVILSCTLGFLYTWTWLAARQFTRVPWNNDLGTKKLQGRVFSDLCKGQKIIFPLQPSAEIPIIKERSTREKKQKLINTYISWYMGDTKGKMSNSPRWIRTPA